MTAYAPSVNVEALLVTLLRADGIPHAYAERIGTTLPYLLVEMAGGPQIRSDSPGQAQVFNIQLTAWADTKGDALDLFYDADFAIRSAVRTQPQWPQGTLNKAKVPRPNYAPDEDVLVEGRPAPRYFAVATITVTP